MDDIEDWLEQPRSKTHKFGLWYIHPLAMSFEGWDAWHSHIKKRHPVQYRVREFCSSVYYRTELWLRDAYYLLRSVFFPCHQRIRKQIPRRWNDLDSIFEDVSFEIILSFYEDEMDIIDWDATERGREFKAWITDAVDYIKVRRQAMLDSVGDCPDVEGDLLRKVAERSMGDEWYAWSDRQREMDRKVMEEDTKILMGLVERRGFFWS